MLRRILVLPVLALVVGCGGSAVGSSGSAGGGGGAAGAAGGSAAAGGFAGASGGSGGVSGGGSSYTLGIGPIDVPAGYENTECVVKRLGNPAPLHVGSIHNVISSSSHHMIVYRTNDTQEILTPFDCTPFVDTLNPDKGAPLMVTQKHDDTLTFPPGVGYSLDANQMVRIELHYINTTTQPVQVQASTTFNVLPDAEYKMAADFLFIGNPDINIPPKSPFTLGPTFFPLPAEFADANFFAITGHEHQLGTNVQISTAANKSDPGTPVYDVPGWDWSEPATLKFDPPFQVPAGGGFNFTCDWNNPTSKSVRFGESATAEMCFFWAYYYPSHGAKVCFHTDQYGTLDVCCPGNALCAQIAQFLGG